MRLILVGGAGLGRRDEQTAADHAKHATQRKNGSSKGDGIISRKGRTEERRRRKNEKTKEEKWTLRISCSEGETVDKQTATPAANELTN